MEYLNQIQSTIEDVIQAIHSVIQVDVTVIDKNYNRIAATGNYVDQIGKKVAINSVFYKALHTGKEFIVESPREEEVCSDCERRQICREFAEVCCPIFVEDEVVGIIGLVAFDPFQKKQIINNKLNLLNFLKRMSEMISSKLLEYKNGVELSRQSKEIQVLLNYIDSSVVSVDSDGHILNCNCKAKNILSIDDHMNIKGIIPDLELTKQSSQGHFTYKYEDALHRYYYQTKPILIEDKLENMVLTISKEEDLIHVMNDMINMRQVITFDQIIGENKHFKQVINSAKQASYSDSTVLIQGDSGTGKELFARAIHFESKRRNEPFVAINCAAIPESLIESELFGYNEGAFTGALKGGKPGKFEIANKGTIFLDEIGDMPIHLQSKLLRVLQEREVERIGSQYAVPIDVRVIAATHQDLSQLIESKMFRADLFYRLNVIPLRLSPLKERIDDIEALATFFLNRYSQKLNKTIEKFDTSVLDFFAVSPWDGNIREMENIVEYAVNMCQTEVIKLSDLPDRFKREYTNSTCLELMTLEAVEKKMIEQAIKRFTMTKEGIKEITQVLGLSRATLYRKIKTYKL